jgi:hypothetical protein
VAGTLVAGALLEVLWWGSSQLVFGVVAPLLVVPSTRYVAERRDPALSLDPVGAVLAVIALAGIVYGIVEAPAAAWTAPEVVLPVAVGLLAVVAFVAHELRSRRPSLGRCRLRPARPACPVGSLLPPSASVWRRHSGPEPGVIQQSGQLRMVERWWIMRNCPLCWIMRVDGSGRETSRRSSLDRAGRSSRRVQGDPDLHRQRVGRRVAPGVAVGR